MGFSLNTSFLYNNDPYLVKPYAVPFSIQACRQRSCFFFFSLPVVSPLCVCVCVTMHINDYLHWHLPPTLWMESKLAASPHMHAQTALNHHHGGCSLFCATVQRHRGAQGRERWYGQPSLEFKHTFVSLRAIRYKCCFTDVFPVVGGASSVWEVYLPCPCVSFQG